MIRGALFPAYLVYLAEFILIFHAEDTESTEWSASHRCGAHTESKIDAEVKDRINRIFISSGFFGIPCFNKNLLDL